MLIDVVTIFPQMFDESLNVGVLGKAQESELMQINVRDLRQFAYDRHRVTDEPPYGGGPGMVMKPEPFFRSVEYCVEEAPPGDNRRVILMTPQGRQMTQPLCEEMAREDHLIVLCPRYEGIDERVRQWVATHELSVGDYVLSGGEFAAMVMIDAVGRLIPGVLGASESLEMESFTRSRLEGPQYTRPSEYRNMHVPQVLLSGNHGAVDRWNHNQSVNRTEKRRPELLSGSGK